MVSENPNSTAKKRRVATLILGLVIWAIALSFIIWAGYRVYRMFVPRQTVAVSVNLKFQDEGLAIEGYVLQGDLLAKSGSVRLTVERRNPHAGLTLYEEIVDGKFETSSPLAGFKDGQKLRVTAEAFVRYGPKNEKTAVGRQDATWNIASLWTRWTLWFGLCLALAYSIVFLVLFTGTWAEHRYKYRLAIMHSYITAGMFLLLPMSLPAFITASPDLAYAMQESPVGVLRVASTKVDKVDLVLNQWALNIGGIPVRNDKETPKQDTPGSFIVPGGLVVPLYVFVLAVLGGAINMTRKVPQLQNALAELMSSTEFEDAIKAAKRGVRALYEVARFSNQVETEPASGEAMAPDQQKASDQQATFKEMSAQLNSGRADLIRQYMYLFTAPFLAIVAYYMLFLIQAELASIVPIVVLISFSCGLLSEAVVGTIVASSDAYLARVRQKAGAVTPS